MRKFVMILVLLIFSSFGFVSADKYAIDQYHYEYNMVDSAVGTGDCPNVVYRESQYNMQFIKYKEGGSTWWEGQGKIINAGNSSNSCDSGCYSGGYNEFTDTGLVTCTKQGGCNQTYIHTDSYTSCDGISQSSNPSIRAYNIESPYYAEGIGGNAVTRCPSFDVSPNSSKTKTSNCMNHYISYLIAKHNFSPTYSCSYSENTVYKTGFCEFPPIYNTTSDDYTCDFDEENYETCSNLTCVLKEEDSRHNLDSNGDGSKDSCCDTTGDDRMYINRIGKKVLGDDGLYDCALLEYREYCGECDWNHDCEKSYGAGWHCCSGNCVSPDKHCCIWGEDCEDLVCNGKYYSDENYERCYDSDENGLYDSCCSKEYDLINTNGVKIEETCCTESKPIGKQKYEVVNETDSCRRSIDVHSDWLFPEVCAECTGILGSAESYCGEGMDCCYGKCYDPDREICCGNDCDAVVKSTAPYHASNSICCDFDGSNSNGAEGVCTGDKPYCDVLSMWKNGSCVSVSGVTNPQHICSECNTDSDCATSHNGNNDWKCCSVSGKGGTCYDSTEELCCGEGECNTLFPKPNICSLDGVTCDTCCVPGSTFFSYDEEITGNPDVDEVINWGIKKLGEFKPKNGNCKYKLNPTFSPIGVRIIWGRSPSWEDDWWEDRYGGDLKW